MLVLSCVVIYSDVWQCFDGFLVPRYHTYMSARSDRHL